MMSNEGRNGVRMISAYMYLACYDIATKQAEASATLAREMESIENGARSIGKVARSFGRYLKSAGKRAFSLSENIKLAKFLFEHGYDITMQEAMAGAMDAVKDVMYAEQFESEDEEPSAPH